jgi:hypothetical protein
MILAVVLALLLLCFMLIRRHIGVPFLAMIAGISVYGLYGEGFAHVLGDWIPNIGEDLWRHILYIVFVAFFPLVLYFRAGKSGLFGVIRFVEAAIFALLLTMLISDSLASIFSFDTLARELANWIQGIQGYLMVAGVIFAYVDTFLYRAGKIY